MQWAACPALFSAGIKEGRRASQKIQKDRHVRQASRDFQKQLSGYGLTTAHILYRRPDHPWLLQSYIWQDYDLCPDFPELFRFLSFWETSIEGRLHAVSVAHSGLIKPAEITAANGIFQLN